MTTPLSDPVLTHARALAERGAWAEVRASLEAAGSASDDSAGRDVLLAHALLLTGGAQSVPPLLGRALGTLERRGDRAGVRTARNLRGAAAFMLGELDIAEEQFGLALALAREDDDVLLAARATNNLGAIAALYGNADRAIASYQLAIPSYQRLGSVRGLAECWHNLAISYRTLGELNAADDAELRAMEYAAEISDERLQAMARVGRAEVALRRGDAAFALATARRAAALFATLPDYLLQADALRVAADASDRLGDSAAADAALEAALTLARGHGHRTQEAQALQTDAEMRQRRGDRRAALSAAVAARACYLEMGSVAAADELSDLIAQLTR